MTRSPHLPVDLEAVGCGIMVEPGDVEGWHEALRVLTQDADMRQAMGAAGRAFAERSWNADLFTAGLATVLDEVAL